MEQIKHDRSGIQDSILFLQDDLESHLQHKGIPVDIVCCLHHLEVPLTMPSFNKTTSCIFYFFDFLFLCWRDQ